MSIWEDTTLTGEWRDYMTSIPQLDIDLTGIPIELTDQCKKTAGKVYYHKLVNTYSVPKMRFSVDAYESMTEEEWLDVLRHEAVHVHTAQNDAYCGHGKIFRKYARMVECQRHCPTFTDAKYTFNCVSCDYSGGKHRYSKTLTSILQGCAKCPHCDDTVVLTGGIDDALNLFNNKNVIRWDDEDYFDRDYHSAIDETIVEKTTSKDQMHDHLEKEHTTSTGPADNVDFDRHSFFG